MNSEHIKLIEPTVELKSEFFAMIKEFKAEGREVMDRIGSTDIENSKDSVKQAKKHAKGIELPDGWVPAITYWLI